MSVLEPTVLRETTETNIKKINTIIAILENHWTEITNAACERFDVDNGIALSLSSIRLSISTIPILFKSICTDIISENVNNVRTNIPHLLKNIDITHAFIVGMLLSSTSFFTNEEKLVLADIDDIRMKYITINYEFIKSHVRK